MSCARLFGAVLKLTDLKVCLFQEAITLATASKELQEFMPNAVAYLRSSMSPEQKDWCGFDCWYRVMMDIAVFGTEENLIEVEE